MFCYTVVSGIRCVLQELMMWSDISSEHPIFLRTVASLTNKQLSSDIVSELERVRSQFSELREDAEQLLERIPTGRAEQPVQIPQAPAMAEDALPYVPVTPHSAYPYEVPVAPPIYQQPAQIMPTCQQPEQVVPQSGQMLHMYVREVRRLVDRFMVLDRRFIDLLVRIRRIGTEDRVWQRLLEHFTSEQEYMYRLMRTLRSQLR